MNLNTYQSPLSCRYASKEMSYNWSPQRKHTLWRKLWLELARAEKELGLDITNEQIAELEAHQNDIDFKRVSEIENKLRHDVMSHIHHFGELCPKAMPIIHLGATSCFVTDNSELIQIKEGMLIIRKKLLNLIKRFSDRAEELATLPTLAFTHFQPAQPTTVGKRLSLYLQDLLLDFNRLEFELDNFQFRGVKGTTGTQASFMSLFKGDSKKVAELDLLVTKRMGFSRSLSVSSQTYTRKIDYYILTVLSGIAQSAYKFACDLRMLSHLGEIEEPWEKSQIGSSAMAYKKNPMRSERICSLARFVMSLMDNPAQTHANQWFERTLDDSANRRIVLPEAFLSIDVILSTLYNIINGLQVWPKIIERNLQREIPFMATENIMMAAVKAGGNRQELHEAIRQHSHSTIREIKELGMNNTLLDKIKNDMLFSAIAGDIDKIVNPSDFIGRAPDQVREFIKNDITPLLEKYAPLLNDNAFDEISV
ncbi:MAG TPA: adenylosuccinate lyase [Lentisphaeria bacterium]|nr:MAG: adenylosuccinate lyase [Lentisphaerae bacterium GWF2_38_69]HBM15953.1 adenylosuccinate lyase [Lentisphaeria bacterium]